jgi:predicted RNase H-like HicB family nuclease
MKLKYSVLIQWSDEDNAYLVTLPEFSAGPQTHGTTYKEAMKHAQELLETFVEFYQEDGRPLPAPQKYTSEKPRKKSSKRRLRHAEAV